ncbi:NACHT domain-containing protein [Tunturiibacter gelidoferens]|uniref:NACHT domain-containing protein n=1 Tax=Tunturiibacter gelidiferens TaxID=3069689 RepID=A0A9X0QDN1_9BACT|nr:NACHT domain-containing protein [Edaphobacter lichenicola]MBB5328422.1 hypothetical protein [Edaphobacter lichenicola]
MPAQYYFDELDPISFQRLVNALLVLRYGEGIRLLPIRGADGGRDAETPPNSVFFAVDVPPPLDKRDRAIVNPGRYLFQVKHHRMADQPASAMRARVVQDFADELSTNVVTREGDSKVDFFFLITNVPSSRDTFQKVDEKRKEYLKNRSDLHAEVLWQDHLTAWLDQAASVWSAFPEIFAGRIVPTVGQIAADPSGGILLSIKLALKAQLLRDSVIRFRQVNLEQRLVLNLMPEQYFRLSALSLLLSSENRHFSKIILEGGPGQGKSTVTQMVAQIYRSLLTGSDSEYLRYSSQVRRVHLPIRVELRLFAEWLGTSDRSVEQYLAESFSKDSGGAVITVEDIHQIVRKQNVLLIFDGLDEVGSDTLRDVVVAKIVDTVTRLETAAEAELRVIVTSRPPAIAGRLDALSGFNRIQLQPLSDNRVNLYVERWTEVQCVDLADRERVTASFSKRRGEDHVAALVKNPMQLSVLLHFIRLKGEAFPDKRAELYREYFKTVIDRDVEKSPELRKNRDDIETLHEVIGFTIHSRAEGTNSAARLPRTELIQLVRDWFQSEGRKTDLGEGLFRIGEERLGLIVALSGEGELTQYGFEIQPIREYFAAAFINDKCEVNAHDLFELMIRRPFWKEVARFFAGLRRVNERADLLSRARQLDLDGDDGWRSDGATIIHQLLLEGVLNAPGHVHREALSFLISSLDPKNGGVRVHPKDLVMNLPHLIAVCDSDRPRQELSVLLGTSRTWADYSDLERLWSVCNRVLSSEELFKGLDEYSGDSKIEATMKLRWPLKAERSFAEELEHAGKLNDIPAEIIVRPWYWAASTDKDLRNLESTKKHHELLIEQFAFKGIFDCLPIEIDSSPFAVWQLSGLLHSAGMVFQNESSPSKGMNIETDFSGISDELIPQIKSLLVGLDLIVRSSGKDRRKTTIEFINRLTEMTFSEGLISLVAGRCTTTLSGYVYGHQRVIRDGRSLWRHRSRESRIPTYMQWKELRSAILPLFRAAFPEDYDKHGRSMSTQLIGRDFHRSMQSHVMWDGKLTPLIALVTNKNSAKGQRASEWLTRIPIQQYWLQSFVTEANVLDVLEMMVIHPLNGSGNKLPLTSDQVILISEIVEKSKDDRSISGVLFAFQGLKKWGRIRGKTVGKILESSPNNSLRGTHLFQRHEYHNARFPTVLANSADKIVEKSLKVSSALSSAAAKYVSENRPSKLPPLREAAGITAQPFRIDLK